MDKQREYARIATFIYILTITLAVVLLIGLPFARPSHAWISLGALLLAETAIYGLILHYLSNNNNLNGLIPGYLAFSAIAGIYLIVVIVFIVIFSLALDITTLSYGLLQFIALALAAIMASLAAIYFRHAEQQDDNSESLVQWVTEMRSTLLAIKQELEDWKHEERGALARGIEALDEKVRCSDPASHPSIALSEESLLYQVRQLGTEISGLVKAVETDEDVERSEKSERLGRQIREMTYLVTSRNQQLIQLK